MTTPQQGKGSNATVQPKKGVAMLLAADKNPQVLLVVDPSGVCFAAVGNHGKVCVYPLGSCPRSSHKHVDREKGLYLTTGNEHQVWDEPHAPTDGIKDSVMSWIKELMETQMSREDWLTVFKAINDFHEASTAKGKQVTEEYLETLVELMVDRHVDGGLTGTKDPVDPSLALTPLPKKPKVKMETPLTDSVEGGLRALRTETYDEFESMGDLVKSCALEGRQMRAALGTPGAGAKPTWNTIEDIQASNKEIWEEVKKQGLAVKANTTRSEQNLGAVTRHTERLNHIDQTQVTNTAELNGLLDPDGWTDAMEEQVDKLTQQYSGLDGVLRNMKTLVSSLENQVKSFPAGGGARTPGGGAMLTALQRKVEALETAVSNGGGNALTSQVGNLVTTDQVNELKEEMLAKIEAVEAAPSGGEADKPFVIDNRIHFSGGKDVDRFVGESGVPVGADDFNFEVPTVINDVFQILEMASSYGATSLSAFSAAEVHAVKVGRSPAESTLAAGFQSMVPSCWTTAGSSELTKLKTFKQFDAEDGVSGVSPCVTTALREVRKAQQVKIDDELRLLPELKDLASYLLMSTCDFVQEWLQWAGNYYRALVTNTGATTEAEKAACWKLTLSMIHTICEVLWEPRRPAQYAHTFPNRKKLVTYLTASLRTQVIMQEFRRTYFSEHPRIFPKLMNFIFGSHTPKIEFVALKERVQTLQDQMASLKRTQDSILTRLKAVERVNGLGGGGDGGGGGGGGRNKKKKDED